MSETVSNERMSTIADDQYTSLLHDCARWALSYDNIIPERVKMDELLRDLTQSFPKIKFELSFKEAAPLLFDMAIEAKDLAAGWVRDYYEPDQVTLDSVIDHGDMGMHPLLAYYLTRGVQEGHLAQATMSQLYHYLQTQPYCALQTFVKETRRSYPEYF